MNKTAIIIGATGLTGGLLLEKLLDDEGYERVKVFARRSVRKEHLKLMEYVVDLFELEKYLKDFTADVVFCCIGTTDAKTPDHETYHKIDYGIPVTVAGLCAQNKIGTFIVISALGANINSSVFYNRTKAEMETDVLKQEIPRTYILQPSLIEGNRDERRTGEYMAKQLMKVMNWMMVGSLKKYKSIHAETIVDAMLWLAKNDYNRSRIESDRIREIAEQI